jgi:hypothetical protein
MWLVLNLGAEGVGTIDRYRSPEENCQVLVRPYLITEYLIPLFFLKYKLFDRGLVGSLGPRMLLGR